MFSEFAVAEFWRPLGGRLGDLTISYLIRFIFNLMPGSWLTASNGAQVNFATFPWSWEESSCLAVNIAWLKPHTKVFPRSSEANSSGSFIVI